jgi:VanZ family protein
LRFDRERWLFYWMPLFAYCALVFVLSARSKAVSGPDIPSGDQILHVIQYSILGFLMVRAFFSLQRPRCKVVLLIISVCVSVLFAFSDELHQLFVSGRTASLADVMADGVGAAIGTVAYWCLGSYNGKTSRIPQQRDSE